ncbi:MAG: MerR family transcriptional regulator [Firmicutes bacterium]|nr:MerR family transcriptional regulator [Bacillota bacterium]
MKAYTIRDLSNASGLSRSTLLYYESIGLLKAEERSEAGYRLYSDKSITRLRQICTYRDAGVPLSEIARILESGGDDAKGTIFTKTLAALNQKACEIQKHQTQIAALLSRKTQQGTLLSRTDKDSAMVSITMFGLDRAIFEHIEQIITDHSRHKAILQMCGFADAEITRMHNILEHQ